MTSGRPAVALQFFLSRNKRSHPCPFHGPAAARPKGGDRHESEDQRQRRRHHLRRLSREPESNTEEVISVKIKTNVKGGGVITGD